MPRRAGSHAHRPAISRRGFLAGLGAAAAAPAFAQVDVRPRIEFPRDAARWKLDWWRPLNSRTVDQTALLQGAIDEYDPAGRELVLELPDDFDIALGGRDPLDLNGKHRLTIEGGPTATLCKLAPDRTLILGATDGEALENIAFRGFAVDGGGVIDSSNDYPLIFLHQARDCLFDNVRATHATTALRVGRGDNLSERVRVRDCRIEDIADNGIELWGCLASEVVGNECIPGPMNGAAPDGIDGNRAIRIIHGCEGVDVMRNAMLRNGRHGWGSAVAINTGPGAPNTRINVAWNEIVGCLSPGYAAIWSDYSLRDSVIAFNRVLGAEGPARRLIRIGHEPTEDAGDRSAGIDIVRNVLRAGGAETHVVALHEVDGFSVLGNSIEHRGGKREEHFGVYIEDSAGTGMVQANRFDMDGPGAVGVRDQGGRAASRIVVDGNEARFDGAGFASQRDSAGTLVESGTRPF